MKGSSNLEIVHLSRFHSIPLESEILRSNQHSIPVRSAKNDLTVVVITQNHGLEYIWRRNAHRGLCLNSPANIFS